MQAYYQHDINGYDHLLAEFEQQYNKLDPPGRQQYMGYLQNAYYNLCCTYAILHDSRKAYTYLEKALRAGYRNYSHMMTDKDLADLRGQERFRQLLAPLRETGDYLYILGKAGRYNAKDTRPLPSFTYLSAKDPNLVALRQGLHLDSIAGGGTEVSQVLNLLHWIHNLIPHDGNHENPAVRNAMNMIAVCKKDNRGLNCRGLATVLNECYLSMGFASRFVTCLPKDSLKIDPDCHVINVVYIRSLQKWIWIDPTNDAYVMNEKGELLGPEEVRQRLIDHRPLIVNPDANWNHKSAVEKENYLYNYMAKNLYMLQCPVNSGYDIETRAEGKEYVYIELFPLDYFAQGPDKEEAAWPKNSRYVNYHTNNPAKFWTAP